MSNQLRSTEYKSEFHKGFIENFRSLNQKHGRYDVWSDFIVMSSCALSNVFDKRYEKEREAEYLKCVSKYTPEEAEKICEMLSYTVLAFDRHPEQDFLGDIFSALNLHDEWRGQFFTPYDVSKMMAKMILPGKENAEGWEKPVTVCDPCCGAGCLLIACANVARSYGVNYQQKIAFYAQDVDRITALMCYVQLSILGCKALVRVGNSLTEPPTENMPLDESVWLTPMLAGEDVFKIVGLFAGGKEETNGLEEGIQCPQNPDEGRKQAERTVPT